MRTLLALATATITWPCGTTTASRFAGVPAAEALVPPGSSSAAVAASAAAVTTEARRTRGATWFRLRGLPGEVGRALLGLLGLGGVDPRLGRLGLGRPGLGRRGGLGRRRRGCRRRGRRRRRDGRRPRGPRGGRLGGGGGAVGRCDRCTEPRDGQHGDGGKERGALRTASHSFLTCGRFRGSHARLRRKGTRRSWSPSLRGGEEQVEHDPRIPPDSG